jgi:hypothetical protein
LLEIGTGSIILREEPVLAWITGKKNNAVHIIMV